MPGRLLSCLVVCLPLLGCSEREPDKDEFFVFGTLVDVSLAGADQAAADAAFSDLQHMFQTMHQDWHAWEPRTEHR